MAEVGASSLAVGSETPRRKWQVWPLATIWFASGPHFGCASAPQPPVLYTVQADVQAGAMDGKGGRELPAELAASGVILQGGKVAFYPRFSCLPDKEAVIAEDRCEKVLSILESQARDAGYWVVPWRTLDARDVHASAKKNGIRYLFEIDTFAIKGPIEGAWGLSKLAFRQQPQGGKEAPLELAPAQPIVDRCAELFRGELAAYQAPMVASMRARLLAIDEERVMWTYQRTLAEQVAPPANFVRYHEVSPPDQRKTFYRRLAWGLAGGSAAALITAAATARAPKAVPWSFLAGGLALGGGAGYTYYQSRQIDAPVELDAAQVMCVPEYAQAQNPWQDAPKATGEVMLADGSKDEGPPLDVRQEMLGAKLLGEFIAAIGPLERKKWASGDDEKNTGKPAKDEGKPQAGGEGKKQELGKWPWVAPGTNCQVIHSGPPGCPVQLICGTTWVQCVNMELPAALPPPPAVAPVATPVPTFVAAPPPAKAAEPAAPRQETPAPAKDVIAPAPASVAPSKESSAPTKEAEPSAAPPAALPSAKKDEGKDPAKSPADTGPSSPPALPIEKAPPKPEAEKAKDGDKAAPKNDKAAAVDDKAKGDML